ncbi:MAG: hypothetical protein Q8927_14740 [Bacteroidota bacterium]|nr:hypothetical protein [Bacteroidota bacterium]MDP4217456.1 hypothetical protein [Bacteroidota bacterium]MDP4246394.1 hypothetical protein [Bacteroidota bacterium]MDP4255417.1 hypothetical protein [Bacteroidota bacterium]MDP4259252.1 hypothetical protein [Bacteroidota bacterium]
MNRVPILVAASLFLLVSCSKDKFATKPSLSIKSINTTVEVQGILDVLFQYTSKKGNLGQGTFVVIRNRLNQEPVPINSANTDTLTGPIPSYPDNSSAEFELKLDWNTLHETDDQDDSVIMKFAAIDRDGHSSDTIQSPLIIIKHP